MIRVWFYATAGVAVVMGSKLVTREGRMRCMNRGIGLYSCKLSP